jgi:hypothetical protein
MGAVTSNLFVTENNTILKKSRIRRSLFALLYYVFLDSTRRSTFSFLKIENVFPEFIVRHFDILGRKPRLLIVLTFKICRIILTVNFLIRYVTK